MSTQIDNSSAIIGTIVLIFAFAGLLVTPYVVVGGPESSIASKCTNDGYWQYGQKRFICHLDTTKYKTEENEFQVKN